MIERAAARILPAAVALALVLLLLPAVSVRAEATDVIRDFTITVDVNEDATLRMTYEIDWTVLDDSIGKLEWIDLGVPNRYHEDITPLSDTIDHIEDHGRNLAIYLDRSYGEAETVSLSFAMTQDHMYQIDKWNEGETVYTFTPAWFDGMEVEELTIRWNAAEADAWQPDCQMEDGYLTFQISLDEGERYTMSVTYPNDAFAFDVDRQGGGSPDDYDGDDEYDDSDDYDDYDDYVEETGLSEVIGMTTALVIFAIPIIFLCRLFRWIRRGFGFGSGQETEKKITRTKIEYYETCPSCGAGRVEGNDICPYCHRSMIKSKEVVEESQIDHPEKYSKKGTYRYGDSGSTYIRVNVVNVPVSRPRSSSHSGRSTRSSGGSHHSSCACACASSCACACACASSGRAGCTVKDFYTESLHRHRVLVESKRAAAPR